MDFLDRHGHRFEFMLVCMIFFSFVMLMWTVAGIMGLVFAAVVAALSLRLALRKYRERSALLKARAARSSTA